MSLRAYSYAAAVLLQGVLHEPLVKGCGGVCAACFESLTRSGERSSRRFIHDFVSLQMRSKKSLG
jgi:hypothetical protein